MMGQNKTVKMSVMTDDRCPCPIDFREHGAQLRGVALDGGVIATPLDRGSVRLEPGIADIRFGRQLGQCIVRAKERLEVKGNDVRH